MTLLPMVLGAVLCSLVLSSDVLPQADFNLEAMAGKWHLIGFASNAQWFVSHKANMRMGITMLTPTAEGDLEVAYSSLKSDGSCWRLNNMAKRTDVAGKFSYTSRRLGNENNMVVADVKYDEYALVHIFTANGDVPTVVNKLYGRGTDLSPDLLEKFRQFSLKAGILPENIAFLPKNAECPAA
ncbi:lipocalin-like [Brachionichthys hirsutus]|uniref:lipocalin-like n=1 Tax=Brachionichthys hirsutus TaxID=412623 RepID=UPI00360461CE